jgi:hypothetical protein
MRTSFTSILRRLTSGIPLTGAYGEAEICLNGLSGLPEQLRPRLQQARRGSLLPLPMSLGEVLNHDVFGEFGAIWKLRISTTRTSSQTPSA